MANNRNSDRDITFEIIEQIGILAYNSTGWKKELNLVKWNDGVPKYDIREWDPDHEHMSRGVTLHEKEMQTIVELIHARNRRENGSCCTGGNGCEANGSTCGSAYNEEQMPMM